MDVNWIIVFRCLTLAVMVAFLPVSAYTYYAYRLGQRKLEIERILRVLDITSDYRNIYPGYRQNAFFRRRSVYHGYRHRRAIGTAAQ